MNGTAIAAGQKSLAAVTIKDASGNSPSLTLPKKPFAVNATVSRVVRPGDGPTVRAGDIVNTHYLLVDGKSGTQADGTFGKAGAPFYVDPKGNVLPGIVAGLTGQRVGSRVLVAMPPADAWGSRGQQQIGVGPGDSVLMYFSIDRAQAPLAKATGTAVPPVAGLPKVRLAANGEPTITNPKTPPPTRLVAQPLIKGTGAKVQAGQSILVQYTGEIYRTGKVFDSSWNHGTAFFTPIGAGQVIPGWDKGLVGQTVGSQVLLVIPPADGYKSAGQPQAGIKGTDTLVFVVDILAAS